MSTYLSNRNTPSYVNTMGHERFHTKLFSGTILDGCQVQATSPGSMGVQVSTGDLIINFQNQFSYTAWIDQTYPLSINYTSSVSSRIDRVIAYINRSVSYPSSPVVSNNPNALQIIIVQGTESVSDPIKPTDSAVQTAVNSIGLNSDGQNNPWVELATVSVLPGVQSITQGQITNTAQEIIPNNLVDQIYPVGSIYMSANNPKNPSTYLGIGTWQPFGTGQVLVNQLVGDANYGNVGQTGGAKTITLNSDQLASHQHTGWTDVHGHHGHSFGGSQNPWAAQIVNTSDWQWYNRRWNRGDRWRSLVDGFVDRWTNPAGDHTHTFTTSSTGGNKAHNNLEPYIVVYCWLRVADNNSPLPQQPIPVSIQTQPIAKIDSKTGSDVSLSVVASGASPLRYQWLVNNVPISNATSSTLSLQSVSPTTTGSYTCQVWNDINSVVSNPCDITVTDPVSPYIISQPLDQFVSNGQTATFTVSAGGDPTLTYQWFRNAAPIEGATGTSYSVSDGTSGSVYQITVTISNSEGSIASNIVSYGVDIPVKAAS